MRPAVVTAALLLGVLLCEVGSTYGIRACRDYPLRACKNGWKRIDDKRCVKYFSKRKSFYAAENHCVSLNGHLVSLHNDNQLYRLVCVTYTYTNTKRRTFWTGTFRHFLTNEFQNTDGSRVDYTHWAPKINPKKGQRCVESDFNQWGDWRNTLCTEKKPYVCAMEQ